METHRQNRLSCDRRLFKTVVSSLRNEWSDKLNIHLGDQHKLAINLKTSPMAEQKSI